MQGNWNRILRINLSNNDIWTEELPLEIWENYIGGVGISSYIFNKMEKYVDPFSPENPLIIFAGPLTGTPYPNTGRHEIVSRSPLTELLGESNSGGFFGNELKRAGYDGIIITGRADSPSIIKIDDSVRIEKRDDLWGRNFYDTQEKIRKEKKFRVMAIGVAGENRVLFSAIMNDEGRAAGRNGLGAVMGSKNLKAVAVFGSKQVPIERRADFLKLAGDASRYLLNSPLTQGLKEYGSMIWMDAGPGLGDVPANYFNDHNFEYDELSGTKFKGLYKVTSYHCANCVIGCGRTVQFGNIIVDGPEYETVAAFGPLLGNKNFDRIIEWNHLINDAGMDTISTGVLISGLNYYLKNGLINNESLKTYYESDFSGISKMINDIAHSSGVGNELKEGLERFAVSNNIPRDMIATVKKMEIPMHDPRAFKLQGLGYATSSRGADHLQAEMYEVDMGMDNENLGIKSGDRWTIDDEQRVETLINTQNYRQIQNSVIICSYAKVDAQSLIDALSFATGFNYDYEKFKQIGENIIDLKRKINKKLGMKNDDDYLPGIVRKKIEGELEESSTSENELKNAINKYYKIRKWND
ncbi:MAG: aldehyde ferredoxin oxidoreductase family protein [Thermoplasmata archaeon]